jgi:hypothetical protein
MYGVEQGLELGKFKSCHGHWQLVAAEGLEKGLTFTSLLDKGGGGKLLGKNAFFIHT